MSSTPPRIWGLMMQTWQVPPDLARSWWHAVARSRWSAVRQWRQQVLLHEQVPLDVSECVERLCTPHTMIDLVEGLCRERLLERRAATRLEEHLLQLMDARGQWV